MSADGMQRIGDMKIRDRDNIAREAFRQLDYLGPVHVPPAHKFSDPEVIKAWRVGGHIEDKHVPEFAQWLERTQARSAAISENERRLNTTTWAQERLKNQGDYLERFEQFHFDAWGIERLSDEPRERSQQVMACARKGMPSVRPVRGKGG